MCVLAYEVDANASNGCFRMRETTIMQCIEHFVDDVEEYFMHYHL